jgi:type II secretory pathway predicted ATPase ExeA
VSVFYRLDPLGVAEAKDYINHRLRVGGREQPLFSDEAIELIWRASAGIARRINTLCDLSLVYGFASGSQAIELATVRDMLRDRKELAVQTVNTPARRGEPGASLHVVPDLPR